MPSAVTRCGLSDHLRGGVKIAHRMTNGRDWSFASIAYLAYGPDLARQGSEMNSGECTRVLRPYRILGFRLPE